MQYEAVLFDLDGTLLPMDYDEFSRGYFHLLSKEAERHGYEKNAFLKAMMVGVNAMVKNDGSKTNEDAFWDTFGALQGGDVRQLIAPFDAFYQTEFKKTKAFTQDNPLAKTLVETAKKQAKKVILATNPLFPLSAVETRLQFVGLSAKDFDGVTSYENSTFCKPNPKYYEEIAQKYGLTLSNCLMVGNNVQEDIKAGTLAGLNTYLITDCLINEEETLPSCPTGSFADCIKFLTKE